MLDGFTGAASAAGGRGSPWEGGEGHACIGEGCEPDLTGLCGHVPWVAVEGQGGVTTSIVRGGVGGKGTFALRRGGDVEEGADGRLLTMDSGCNALIICWVADRVNP